MEVIHLLSYLYTSTGMQRSMRRLQRNFPCRSDFVRFPCDRRDTGWGGATRNALMPPIRPALVSRSAFCLHLKLKQKTIRVLSIPLFLREVKIELGNLRKRKCLVFQEELKLPSSPHFILYCCYDGNVVT